MENQILREKVESAILEASDVYIPPGEDREKFLAGIAADIRNHWCAPFEVEAIVEQPGFPDIHVGNKIRAICVAHRDGYWLVYDPSRERFYCFWGESPELLGAHGVVGSPLYCWSA